MIEKIFIDSIQENALLTFKKEGYRFSDFVLTDFLPALDPSFAVLTEFSAEEFSLLLNGWYVVVDPVRINQWFRYDGRYEKIAGFDTRHVYFYHPKGKHLDFTKVSKEKFYLHAREVTNRWEKILLDLGREYPAPQVGDIYLDDEGIHLVETMDDIFQKASPAWSKGKIVKYYPHEVGFKK